MKPEEEAKSPLVTLQEQVKIATECHGKDSARHKHLAICLRMISVTLAASLTILLGLKLGEDYQYLNDIFSNISLMLGAIITVVSAFEAFFDPRSLWIRETVTFARLKDLQRDLALFAASNASKDPDLAQLDNFKQRLDGILADALRYWMRLRGAPEAEPPLNDLKQ